MASHPPRQRHLVWPILLIGLGLLFLLQNFGLLPGSLWELLWRFWPVIIILIGLELLLNRTSPWLAAGAAALVVVALIAGGLALSALGYGNTRWMSSPGQSEHLTQELGSQERARVELQFGAGNLYLNSLPGDSANLMEGDFEHQGTGRTVSRSWTCRSGPCVLRLTSRSERDWPFGSAGADEWRVGLSPRIPLDLQLQAGASRADLDLTGLQLNGLRIDFGASSGFVKLPQTMGGVAAVKAGAADLTFEVPAETAARIRAKGGLSSLQIDEQRFPRNGDYYTSPDFATAPNRVDLEIDAGVATVRVK